MAGVIESSRALFSASHKSVKVMQSEAIRHPYLPDAVSQLSGPPLWAVAIILLVSVVSGCSAPKRESTGVDQPVNIAMMEVNELCFTFEKAEGKPAAKLSDFDKLKQTWPRGYKAVQTGDIVVLWGTSLSNEAPIAYEKATPEKGGLVLFGNGTTKTLTPEAFSSLVKK
jgi:hypothetical protein